MRQIEQPELAHTAQRRQREFAKLVVRQVEDLQRSEWIKGATPVTVAIRTAEGLERVVAELEVLQHLGLYEIVRVQLRRHKFGRPSIASLIVLKLRVINAQYCRDEYHFDCTRRV